jgi:hypothetical protein
MQNKSLIVICGSRKIRLQLLESLSWAEEYTEQDKLKRTRHVMYQQDDRLGYTSAES